MSRILIATIARNAEANLQTYRDQIRDFVWAMPEHEFFLSVYENDSSDRTREMLNDLDWSFCAEIKISSHTLGHPRYGSVVNADRVMKLADYRNAAIHESGFLSFVDKIAVIESDTTYPVRTPVGLINSSVSADVISGVSLFPGTAVPLQTVYVQGTPYRLYDTWATRRTPHEEWGDIRADYLENPIAPFWSTFNGFCVYRAQPFREGAAFAGFNRRLNKYDCDPAVLCEEFRDRGYTDIYINQSLYCFHQ